MVQRVKKTLHAIQPLILQQLEYNVSENKNPTQKYLCRRPPTKDGRSRILCCVFTVAHTVFCHCSSGDFCEFVFSENALERPGAGKQLQQCGTMFWHERRAIHDPDSRSLLRACRQSDRVHVPIGGRRECDVPATQRAGGAAVSSRIHGCTEL